MTETRVMWLLLGVVAFLFGSIVVLAIIASHDADDLVGTKWTLDSILVDGALTPPVDGTTITLEFADEGVIGSGGCNNYFGGYTVDGDAISFTQMGSTQMFCMEPEGVADQETAYLQMIGTADRYRLDSGQLVLLSDDEEILTFTN